MAKTTALKPTPKAAPMAPIGDELRAVAPLSQGQAGDSTGDMIAVPFLPQPYAKAPAVDPYLRPETITTHTVAVAGYDLPAVQRGIQPGLDFDGNPVDRTVSVVWMSRRHIDAMARAMARQHPELAQGLEIMRAFMCDMDTTRDAVAGEVADARRRIKAGDLDGADAVLGHARELLGRWNDERRLGLS